MMIEKAPQPANLRQGNLISSLPFFIHMAKIPSSQTFYKAGEKVAYCDYAEIVETLLGSVLSVQSTSTFFDVL